MKKQSLLILIILSALILAVSCNGSVGYTNVKWYGNIRYSDFNWQTKLYDSKNISYGEAIPELDAPALSETDAQYMTFKYWATYDEETDTYSPYDYEKLKDVSILKLYAVWDYAKFDCKLILADSTEHDFQLEYKELVDLRDFFEELGYTTGEHVDGKQFIGFKTPIYRDNDTGTVNYDYYYEAMIDLSVYTEGLEFIESYADDGDVFEITADGVISFADAGPLGTGDVYDSYYARVREIYIPDELDSITVTGIADNFVSRLNEWYYAGSRVEKVVLPETVTSIGAHAFHNCDCLTDIDLSHVRTFGEYALAGCWRLEEVNFPAAVTIGDYAFSSLNSAKTLVIPDSVTTLGKGAFSSFGSNVREGASITIGTGITELPDECFHCAFQSLKDEEAITVTLPAAITAVGDEAFYNMKVKEIVCTNATGVEFGEKSISAIFRYADPNADPADRVFLKLAIRIPAEADLETYITHADNWATGEPAETWDDTLFEIVR